MKKFTLFTLFFAFTAMAVHAQEQEDTFDNLEYNNWSIDFGFGVNKPSRNLSPGVQSEWFENFSLNLGARYMINDKFGLRASAGYYEVLSSNEVEFENNFFSVSGEGVANLGTILGFKQWTNRINLLAHAGLGYGQNNFDTNSPKDGGKDGSLHVIAGLTPQVKLSDRFALNLDVSYFGNIRQDWTWDGYSRNYGSGFDGSMVNLSVGLSIYLGDAEKHADWVDNSPEKRFASKVGELENKLDQLERDMQDDDKDGVPNYLDTEPNTTSGVAVNSKGEAVDKNDNGVPDEIEASLDKKYATKERVEQQMREGGAGGGLSGVKSLANNGLINVYFQFNSSQPEYYSLDAINSIVKYMKANPDAQATLTGYADEIGNTAYNKTLSENRAKRVYDIVIAAGIDESRLDYTGGGVDSSVDKSSSAARQIVRRVTFELK
ncbi:OmpA family protein [Psychroflexus aestuariivivens]|uniref:OmpA family protein n=1 Tax=Psychroflexus aestuariivivens TaxID=1795040 RepID=UPI000FD6DB37|nr:OmpA family protein [Psychroflexus aestuariivivens]